MIRQELFCMLIISKVFYGIEYSITSLCSFGCLMFNAFLLLYCYFYWRFKFSYIARTLCQTGADKPGP